MHFWIDKRSQTCGYSGRHRVPSSLSAGACRPNVRCSSSIWGGACGGGGGGGAGVCSCPRPSQNKSMVTPVHRFQSIESAAIAGSSRPRRHAAHPLPASLHRFRSPPCAAGSGPHRGADVHAVHEQPPPQPLLPDRGGVHVANVVGDAPLDSADRHRHHRHQQQQQRLAGAHGSATPDTLHGPHLVYPKYKSRSIWISVTLLTVLSGCAMLLISKEISFGEIVVFAIIFLTALFASFYVTQCHRTVASWEMLEALVTQPQDPAVQDDGARAGEPSAEPVRAPRVRRDGSPPERQVSQDDLAPDAVRPPQRATASPGPPPPPYHIAILLPEQGGVDVSAIVNESPPPSYEKAIG